MKIKRIVVHCTDEYPDSKRNREYYRHWFFDVLGYKHYGYHAVVYPNGDWDILQPLPKYTTEGDNITDETMACGAMGFNYDSLHIAYVGGRVRGTDQKADTRTPEQKKTLLAMIKLWKQQYKVNIVCGHRDLPAVKKACPCFDAKTEYANV